MKRISFALSDRSDRTQFAAAVRRLQQALRSGWTLAAADEGFWGGLPVGRFVVVDGGKRETLPFRLGPAAMAAYRGAVLEVAEATAEEGPFTGAGVEGTGAKATGYLEVGGKVSTRTRTRGAATPLREAGVPSAAGKPLPTAYDLDEAGALEALRSGKGDGAEQLKALLGDDYFRLLGDMARRAPRPSTRAGRRPKALVLPGIMGSKLGTEKKLFGALPYSDVIWLDPVDMRLGRLADLKLTDEGRAVKGTQSVGVLYSFYLRLKLSLDLGGFDADFHHYDWRRPVRDLGKEFAEFLNRQKEPVTIVAHSMGGIVTRAALKAGVKKGKIERFIMLGTPNHGSFVPAQAMRAAYPFLKTLALTFDRDLVTVTEDVFSSFTGLYDLLAAPAKFGNFPLFDPDRWPTSRPKARPDLIKSAESAQSWLATPEMMADLIGKSHHLICGVNQDTIVDVKVENNEFVFLQNKDGDGTVPRISAELPGCPTLYVDGSHGMLPNYGGVCAMAVDLAREGRTDRESLTWVKPVGPLQEVRESSLRAAPAAVRGVIAGEEPSPVVVRAIVEPLLGLPALDASELAAGAAPAPSPGGPGVGGGVPVEPGPSGGAPEPDKTPAAAKPTPWLMDGLKGIVVGRHRQRQLEVALFPGSLTDVPSRAYLLGLFQGVAPAGAALAVDDRMGRVISDFVQRRMLSGRLGEVFIVPKGRSFILADHVIFVGLGTFDRFKVTGDGGQREGGAAELDTMRVVCESVVRTCLHANIEEFATILLGSSAASSTGEAVEFFTRSFLDALKVADPERRLRKVTLCERDSVRVAEIRTELVRLATTDMFEDVELELRDLPPPTAASVTPVSGPSRAVVSGRPSVNPVYLLARMFDPSVSGGPEALTPGGGGAGSGKEIVIETSLLLPRSKAAVLTRQRRIQTSFKESLLAKTTGGGLTAKRLAEVGKGLVELAFDEAMKSALKEVSKEVRGLPLVVVHDPVASQLPWEAFEFDGWRPSVEGGVSRQHLDANLSVAKWLERRAEEPVLDVLLVTNPTGDLDGAEREGEMISELLSKVENVRLTERRGDQATRERLLADFRTGKYDVVHYAGHAFFAPQNPGRSGLLCAGEEVLAGVDIAGLSSLPSLVFFNACESGRVRGRPVLRKRQGADGKARAAVSTAPDRPRASKPSDNLSMAAALIRGGIANFLGTYWPVGDVAAESFSRIFYPLLVRGTPIGRAVLEARKAVEAAGSTDWADYILYGNPDFALKRGQPE